MLKKSLAALPRSLVLALLCAGAMAQASAQSGMSRIGFVYTQRLMTESKLAKAADARTFIQACGQLRYWPRELEVDLDAVA